MSSYLLKVSLRGTPQLIWRRFVVPSFTSLNRLHVIIQAVMGWENQHPHAFRFRKQFYVPGTCAAGTSAENGGENRKKNAETGAKSVKESTVETLPDEMFALDDLVFQAGAKIQYFYDPAGANWVHDVNVECIRYLNPDWPYPIYCLEGVRACPPESCGGIDGFCKLLNALKTNDLGDLGVIDLNGFDPDGFSPEKVNRSFKVDGPAQATILPGPAVVKKMAKSGQKSGKADPLFRLGQTLKSETTKTGSLKKRAAS